MRVLCRRCVTLFHGVTFPLRQDGERCTKTIKHIFILFLLTFLFILPLLFYKYRYSKYHIEQRTKAQETEFLKSENTERVLEGEKLVRSYKDVLLKNKELSLSVSSKAKINVAITIITTLRNRRGVDNYKPRYLTQVVSAYLKLLSTTEAQQRSYKLFLCNVDPHPPTYEEFKNFSSLLPYFQRFPDAKDPVHYGDIFKKEGEDYVYCLNETLKTGAENVLLVEDDALPLNDLIYMVNHVIDYHWENPQWDYTRGSTGVTQPPAYVKFYHPDRLLGYWSPEPDRITQLLASGLFFGSLLFFIYRRCFDYDLHKCSAFLVWLFFVIYVILTCVVIGRQNLIEWRRISKYFYIYTKAASCCTPALLFPKKGAADVVRYLSKKPCFRLFPKDLALEYFIKDTGAKAYMIEPNLFRHIGLFSSVRDSLVNPFLM